MSLYLEMYDSTLARWKTIGEVRESMPPGSLSNVAAGRRDVLQFECKGDHSVIGRSLAGADAEIGLAPGGRELRRVLSVGIEELARLADGQTYELDVQTDRMARPMRCRFRHGVI